MLTADAWPATTVGMVVGEAGWPAGAEAPAWFLLLNLLRREMAGLERLVIAEDAEAERLRTQSERRREITSRWNAAAGP